MKGLTLAFSAALFLVIVGSGTGSCADVVGSVTDFAGRSVRGAVITAKDTADKVQSQAVTDVQGHYILSGLRPGQYRYFLNVKSLGFKNGAAVAPMGMGGLTIDWKVSSQNAAMAMATDGVNTSTALAGDPFGLTWPEFLGVAAIPVVAGGVIGGYAAAGGFNGGSGHAASPAL